MKIRNLILRTLLILCAFISCKERETKLGGAVVQELNPELEKQAILERLNNETTDAFQRDYEAWTKNWVHDPSISKVYMNFADSTFSESIGWKEISQFVKTFIEEHPEPEPVPELLNEINVRLYGNGAWVTYEQQDSLRGLKRESRLMEKVNGDWKIAGMQTTIYGFGTDKTNK
uniref:SnoaL-like domain-containing protein n=1 Tax=Roseihalotalea indica TaxID=2867963 RepID=A0AA49GMD5_9BACT|nr:hypothetical protein K4G66_22920 [Tunicatimonas sp. TK19036]